MKLDAALLVVLQDLDRQREPGRVAGPGDRAADFPARAEAVQGLALLQRDDLGKLAGVFLDRRRHGRAGRLQRLVALRRP